MQASRELQAEFEKLAPLVWQGRSWAHRGDFDNDVLWLPTGAHYNISSLCDLYRAFRNGYQHLSGVLEEKEQEEYLG